MAYHLNYQCHRASYSLIPSRLTRRRLRRRRRVDPHDKGQAEAVSEKYGAEIEALYIERRPRGSSVGRLG
jgi:hypothetical protein